MKRIKAVVILVVAAAVVLTSCNEEQKRILNRLMNTETGQYSGEEVDTQRVSELEEHVERFSDEVQDLVEETGKLGIYYKMLALEYMDQEMYGPAREYFLKSLEVYPNNHLVQYYTGLASAQTVGAQANEAQRSSRLEEAAYHYQRAVELKSDYFEALYALSVLYIFELDRALQAEEFVQRALEVRPRSQKARFLLAAIRVRQNRFEEAIEIYNQIIEETEDATMQQRARENREQLLGGGYNG